MNWVLEHIQDIAAVIGYASIGAQFLPTKTQMKIGVFIRVISVAVNAIALDFKSVKAAAENKNVVVTSKDRSELNG